MEVDVYMEFQELHRKLDLLIEALEEGEDEEEQHTPKERS